MFALRYCKFGGVQSLRSSDISVLGHFGPWPWLACRILAGGCNWVGMVRVMSRQKIWVRDQCVQGLKCLRTEVTIHQFGPIYHTEIIAIVQCM